VVSISCAIAQIIIISISYKRFEPWLAQAVDTKRTKFVLDMLPLARNWSGVQQHL
jgi:hypothetical protein